VARAIGHLKFEIPDQAKRGGSWGAILGETPNPQAGAKTPTANQALKNV
jgi:hypothetical protein